MCIRDRFRVLYGQEVNIIKPSDFLIKPSDADYGFAQDFVVKPITGDPRNLKGSTLFKTLMKMTVILEVPLVRYQM